MGSQYSKGDMGSLRSSLQDVGTSYKPISFGCEDHDIIKYVFGEYEKLLKLDPSQIVLYIKRKGFYNKDIKLYQSFDKIYVYQISNFTYRGTMCYPCVVYTMTSWTIDGIPFKCITENTYRSEINEILNNPTLGCDSAIYRQPYSCLVRCDPSDRKYIYYHKHFDFDIDEIGFVDIVGSDMLIKHKRYINQHKVKIEATTLDQFLTDQLNRVIIILKNIEDDKLTQQIETILNNIVEHGMRNMEKIIVLLKKILSKKKTKKKAIKYLKKILKQVNTSTWNTIDVAEILMGLDEYHMPNFIATFFQPDASFEAPLDEDDDVELMDVELMDVGEMLMQEYRKYYKYKK